MTREDLIKIFYSNYNGKIDYGLIDELLFLINETCINYESKIITNKDEYDLFIDKLDSGEIKNYDIAHGGKGHNALKLIAIKYLGQPTSKINSENWLQGYVPDLMFKKPDNKIIIAECGDTHPGKIFDYFNRKDVERVIILPYPSDDNLIYQHIFTRNQSLDEYIEIKNNISLKGAKKIIMKR